MFLGDGRIEDKKGRDGREQEKSSWETGTYEKFVRGSINPPEYSRYESRSGV